MTGLSSLKKLGDIIAGNHFAFDAILCDNTDSYDTTTGTVAIDSQR